MDEAFRRSDETGAVNQAAHDAGEVPMPVDVEGDFTPDTASVKAAYCVAGTVVEDDSFINDYAQRVVAALPLHGDEFDRWLAAHDAKVRTEHGERIARVIEQQDITDNAALNPRFRDGYRIATKDAALIARLGGTS